MPKKIYPKPKGRPRKVVPAGPRKPSTKPKVASPQIPKGVGDSMEKPVTSKGKRY
jgi:hypothetical protein